MDEMPFHLIPSAVVFRAMLAEVSKAAEESRVPYLYCDLTCREMLPLWLPEEAVGGKLVLPGALESQPVSDAGGAHAMEHLFTKALRAMTQHPRFFRSMSQWASCIQRHNIAAV